MTRWIAALPLVVALGAPPAFAQENHLLVIAGLSGDPENAALFDRWAATLVDAARGPFKLPAESVLYLSEDPSRDPKRATGRSTREGIETAVAALASRARPGDHVFVVLIGHGDTTGAEPRVNLPGPDLAARDFARLMERFKAQTVVFVDTTEASASFVPALAGRDRVVITATKTDGERNQTRFAEFLVQAFTTPEADADKDGRISMLEAFLWAKRKVAESYEQQGQILTEHAVLDDDGNGKGSDNPGQPGNDGALARTLFLAPDSSRAAPETVSDPALRALYEERRALEDKLGTLKAARDTTDPAAYDREMEQLLIDLAKKNREIRDKEKK